MGISTIRNAYGRKLKSYFVRSYRSIVKSIYTTKNKKLFSSREFSDVLSNTDLSRIEREIDTIIKNEILIPSYKTVPGYTKNSYNKGKEFGTKMLKAADFDEEMPDYSNFRDNDAINYLKKSTLNNIGNASTDLRFGVRNIIINAIDKGKSIREIKIEIKNLFKKLPASDMKAWPNWKKLSQKQKLGLRAEFIGRTATMEAFDKGALNRYSEVGIKKVRWEITGKACPLCAAMDGNVYLISNAPSMPLHVLCMCVWIAVFEKAS